MRIKDGKIFNRNDQLLHCDLDELGCESTWLDPYAYNWKPPENCILSVLNEDYEHILKNDNHYCIVSQKFSENKYLLEVKNCPNTLLRNQQKSTQLHTTQCLLQFTTVDLIWKQDGKINELGAHLLQNQNNAFFSKPGTSTSIVLRPNQPIPILTHGWIWTTNYNTEQNLTTSSSRVPDHDRHQNWIYWRTNANNKESKVSLSLCYHLKVPD